MNKTAIYLAVVTGFTLGASLAYAEPMAYGDPAKQDGPQRGQMEDRIFQNMDTNGDNAISRAEFDAFHDRRFKRSDANNDGKITRDEMSAPRLKSMSRNNIFDETDANHDGALTREEALKMPMLSRNFENVDANHDGKVTREEMAAERGRMRGGPDRIENNSQY